MSTPWRSAVDQRIDGLQLGEAAKVPVCRPQHADPVMEAQRGNASIVNLGTADFASLEHPAKDRPVAGGLAEQADLGIFEPTVQLREGSLERARWVMNPWVSVDADEVTEQ